jgi:hypothetical protein
MTSLSLQLQSAPSLYNFSDITPADAISAATTLFNEGKMSEQNMAMLDDIAGQFGNIYGQTSGLISDTSDPQKVDFYKPVEAAVQFYKSEPGAAGNGSSSASTAISTAADSYLQRVDPTDDEALYSNLLASMEASQSPPAASTTISVSA